MRTNVLEVENRTLACSVEHDGGSKVTDLGDLGDAAKGNIGAKSLDEIEKRDALVTEIISDGGAGIYEELIEWWQRIACACIDGRHPGEFECPRADTAGASIGLYFATLAVGLLDSAEGFCRRMSQAGLPVCAHDDDHGVGCGANYYEMQISEEIENHRDVIDQMRGNLGYKDNSLVNENTIKEFRLYAEASPDNSIDVAAQKADERILAVSKANGEDAISHLEGSHGEVVIIWNIRQNTSLDRAALSELVKEKGWYNDDGTEMEIFSVDAWCFEDSAEKTLRAQMGAKFNLETGEETEPPRREPTKKEIKTAVDFLIDYNLATGLVLGNRNIKVLLRQ